MHIITCTGFQRYGTGTITGTVVVHSISGSGQRALQ
jgi:hypothetical protein